MTWDVHIIGRELDVTAGELARGLALAWRPSDPTRPDLPDGNFAAADEERTPRLVRFHVDPPEYLEEVIESGELGPALTEALVSATHEYALGVHSEHDPDWVRTVAGLVADIARRTGGVVYEAVEDRYFAVDEWLAWRAGGAAR